MNEYPPSRTPPRGIAVVGRGFLRGFVVPACLALAACSSTSGSGVSGEISLGAGGRARGTIDVPARVETFIGLRNSDPGLADFRISTAKGELLQGGTLGTAETKYLSEVADQVIVEVTATGDVPVVFEYAVRSAAGADIVWDLQHAASGAER